MLEIYLIRHGKTFGNTQGRYIGVTDEGLCDEGRKELEGIRYPKVDAVLTSPMRRCLETASVIYPHMDARLIDHFRECDFGVFENKNYLDLQHDPRYQAWIDSNGCMPIPEGEETQSFRTRCREGFSQALEMLLAETGVEKAALIVHGGTIMSILEVYGNPPGDFYRWQAKNGQGYRLEVNSELFLCKREIELVVKGELSDS